MDPVEPDPMNVVCDLDGVIWLGDTPIRGAADAVAKLRGAGHRVLFVTNNSFAPVADVEAKLARHGIPAEGDVLTSAMAAARLIEPGQRVFLCAGPGAREEIEARGAIVVDTHDGDDEPRVDAVVVGFHRTFDYEELRKAAGAVRRGATLIGTNDDATYPTADGPIPGGGSILAAVQVGSGATAIVTGKPYAAMAGLVRAELASVGGPSLMIGDRPDTDGRFSVELGVPFALVLSGVVKRSHLPVEPAPHHIADDIAALASTLLGQ
ncbi:MAG: HAD-IIA family hydrolase [Acidimicrobiia bacterium]